MKHVIKRDGTLQVFDTERISNAIQKASVSVDAKFDVDELTMKVVQKLDGDEIHIEKIQDIVEQTLMVCGEYDTLKHYILYRNEKQKQRDLGVLNLKNLPDIETPWGSLGFLTAARTYFRREDNGSFKNAILRVLIACQNQLKVGFTNNELRTAYEHFMKLRGSVAGRFLWTLGTETVARYGLLSLQNCAFVKVDDPIRPFTWCLDCLMCGTGVGVNVQRCNVGLLPPVIDKEIEIVRKDTKDADFIIPDSRQGWVCFLEQVLRSFFFTGRGFTYSTVCIRPAGLPILGFGGTSSGPEPLAEGCVNICSVLSARRGQKLRPIDCMDIIDIIGSIVVAGNVRRCLPKGALVHTDRGLVPIEKVNTGDKVLVSDGGYRNVANTFVQGRQKLVCIKTTDGEFRCTPNHKMAVASTGTLYTWKPAGELRKGDHLLNPRVSISGVKTTLPPCDGKTPELTPDMAWFLGLYNNNMMTRVASKGVVVILYAQTYTIANKIRKQLELLDPHVGASIHKTDDCGFVIKSQSVFSKVGGYLNENFYGCFVPECILQAETDIRIAYIAGVIDSHNSNYILSKAPKQWALSIQKLCYSCGFETRLFGETMCKKTYYKLKAYTNFSKTFLSTIPYLHNHNAHKSSFWERLFHKKESNVGLHRVMVESVGPDTEEETFDIEVASRHEFFCDGHLTHNSAIIVMGDADDDEYLNAKNWAGGDVPNWRCMSNNSVVCDNIDNLPEAFWKGYDGSGEPYGLINLDLARRAGRLKDGDKYPDPCVEGFNPCAEQSLCNFETCCLAEIFLPNIETYEQLQSVATILYRICKHSLLLPCHHPETEKIVHENMRMGIGVTGVCDSTEEQLGWLDPLYEHLRKYDEGYSKKIGCPTSVKLTTCKPSGTLSLLPGVSPGVHPTLYQYYIRRIRIASSNPLVELCRKHGCHVEPQLNFDGTYDTKTMVVEFPCKARDNTILSKDMSAIRQLELSKFIQTNWSDNSVSQSCYYDKEDLPLIKEWLKKNYNNSLKTVSFFLRYDHNFKQAPYEEITKEKYEELIRKVKPITSGTIETDDTDTSTECVGGACPIK